MVNILDRWCSNLGSHRAWQLWIVLFWAEWRMDELGLLCCGNLRPVFIFCTYTIWSWGCEAFVLGQITPGVENFKFYNNSTYNFEMHNAGHIRLLLLLLQFLEKLELMFVKSSWLNNDELLHVSSFFRKEFTSLRREIRLKCSNLL